MTKERKEGLSDERCGCDKGCGGGRNGHVRKNLNGHKTY